MPNPGLRHISLKTRDLEKTERFYIDVLGLEVAFRSPPKRVFLRSILLSDSYARAIPPTGSQIIGAWFRDIVDLSLLTVRYPLVFVFCRFDQTVSMMRLRTTDSISLRGSKFTGALNMNSIRIDGDLLMDTQAWFSKVDLACAIVGGIVDMRGSKFTSDLNMSSLQIGGDLYMSDQAQFAEVNLGLGFYG